MIQVLFFNNAIKLLQGLTPTSYVDIKGFLSDVKPALISALEAEYEKNPFEVTSWVADHLLT